MGYTNYFHVKKGLNEFDDRFLWDVERAVNRFNEKNPNDTVWFVNYRPTCIAIEGPGVTHENLVISLEPEECEPKDRDYIFGCCKTQMDTYDIIVKAVIMIAAKHGIVESYSADGYEGESELAKAAQEIVDEIIPPSP